MKTNTNMANLYNMDGLQNKLNQQKQQICYHSMQTTTNYIPDNDCTCNIFNSDKSFNKNEYQSLELLWVIKNQQIEENEFWNNYKGQQVRIQSFKINYQLQEVNNFIEKNIEECKNDHKFGQEASLLIKNDSTNNSNDLTYPNQDFQLIESQSKEIQLENNHSLINNQIQSSYQQQVLTRENLENQEQMKSVIKTDQGMKQLLRGFRKCFKRLFEKYGQRKSKYQNNYEQLQDDIKNFLQNEFGLDADKYFWIATILVFPKFIGKIQRKKTIKNRKNMFSYTNFIKNLGKDGMKIFVNIFENNNKYLVEKFFTHQFIKEVWPKIELNMTEQDCFKNKQPHVNIQYTFSLIPSILSKYQIDLPEWWYIRFCSSKR